MLCQLTNSSTRGLRLTCDHDTRVGLDFLPMFLYLVASSFLDLTGTSSVPSKRPVMHISKLRAVWVNCIEIPVMRLSLSSWARCSSFAHASSVARSCCLALSRCLKKANRCSSPFCFLSSSHFRCNAAISAISALVYLYNTNSNRYVQRTNNLHSLCWDLAIVSDHR